MLLWQGNDSLVNVADVIRYTDFQDDLQARAAAGPTQAMQFSDTGAIEPVPPGGLTGRPARPTRVGDVGSSLVGAAVDAVCLVRSEYPKSFLGQITGVADLATPPGVRNARERLFNNLCGETPEAQPSLDSGISGGQCDGVAYFVTVEGASQSQFPECAFDNQKTSQTVEHWGPIGGARANVRGLGLVDIYTRGSVGDGPPKAPAWRSLTSFGNYADCGGGAIITSTSVSRSDSLPDVCGDGPLQPKQDPTSGPPVNISVDFPISVDATVNFPVEVDLAPDNLVIINVGGINVTFDGVDISIDFNPEFGGDDSLPPAGAGGGDCDPIAPTDGEGPPDTEPPDVPPEDPPAPPAPPTAVTTIRGAYVTMTGNEGGATKVMGDGSAPPVFFPDLGLVSFQIVVEGGFVGWTPYERIQLRQGYYECPATFGAADVKVITRPGLSARVDPVYFTTET